MYLELKPTVIGMQISANIPNQRSAFAGTQQLTLDVHLAGRDDHLDLETGEVFRNPSWARTRGAKETVSGSITIRQARNAEDFGSNDMRYFERQSFEDSEIPPQIHFHLCLPSDDFQQLITNARGGLLPSSILIELAHNLFEKPSEKPSPIQYGWEPDGSGKKWNNRLEENRCIKIEGATFNFEMLRPVRDRSTGEIAESAPLSPAESMQAQTAIIKAALLSILSEIRHVGLAVAAIGGVILLVLLFKR